MESFFFVIFVIPADAGIQFGLECNKKEHDE